MKVELKERERMGVGGQTETQRKQQESERDMSKKTIRIPEHTRKIRVEGTSIRNYGWNLYNCLQINSILKVGSFTKFFALGKNGF